MRRASARRCCGCPDRQLAPRVCSARCGDRPLSQRRGAYYLCPMPTLIAGAVAVILLSSLLQMFRAANPVVLARSIKIGGGVLALAVAAFTGAKGELAVAIPLGLFGAGLLGWSPFGAAGFSNIGGLFGSSTRRSPGQTSQVRSHFLDMTLDH